MIRILAVLMLCLCAWQSRALAAPAAFDNSGFVAALCAQDQAKRFDAVKALAAQAPGLDVATLAWLRKVLHAYSRSDVVCLPGGSAYLRAGAKWESLGGSGGTRATAPANASAPFLNLPMRRLLQTTGAVLSLLVAPSDREKIAAARRLQNTSGVLSKALLDRALALAKNPQVEEALKRIRVDVILREGSVAEKEAALAELARHPSVDNRNRLLRLISQGDFKQSQELTAAAKQSLSRIDTWLEVGKWLTIGYQGLSYGSVLFMAALGLAIIFGLMGVINLAQGEFIMLGAYMTWFVQEAVKHAAPGMLDWYLVIAIPFAFGGPAIVGMIIEWAVVRHLYHRPLMTLLATWGISLLLINLVRVTIGTQNIGFYTPSYLMGGFTVLGNFSVTWARLVSIAFALATLLMTLFILFKTRLGLEIRATTQHRRMAACVGISTRRIDSLTFAFGSGLAGLAGLALAMIYNVNPTMGTSFIVDSFIVVVVGGVGSVLGTGLAALGIGQVNAIIQPYYGSVVAKVIVLLAVILFIQQRPGGLFPRKGRR